MKINFAARTITAALALAVLFAPNAHARTKLATLPEREVAAVRFDNPAATLVEEERVLTLKEGENQVDFSWRGVRVEPDSVRLALLSHPDKVRLLSVSYPPAEEALVWRIWSPGALEERVRVSYLLSAIDRLVEYRAVAGKDEKTLDISAYLVIRNFSGEDFASASFSLGQGKSFDGRSSHEETRKILFLDTKATPIKKTLTWDSAEKPWEPKQLNSDVSLPVEYVLKNDEPSGLGKDLLWNGKFRVFQDDGRGSTIFLGEDNAKLTPRGGELKLRLGESREVRVTQKKTADRVINPRPSRQTVVLYDTEEVVECEVENFKSEAAVVDVIEHIPGEWKMAQASLPYEKKDAGTLIFKVTVPASGKAMFSYSYSRLNVRK